MGNWIRKRFTTSARFNLSSGTPYTRVIGEFRRSEYDPVVHEFTGDEWVQFLTGPRNAERLPLAQRLDLSVTRNGRPGGATFSPFLSVMNVYNARNTFAYVYNYGQTPPERVYLRQLPIFPTLGVSVVW